VRTPLTCSLLVVPPWVAAGKLGWVTNTPGAQLHFQVDTRAPEASGYRGPVAVSVAYLLSYEKMVRETPS
jgi:hypothetical protein